MLDDRLACAAFTNQCTPLQIDTEKSHAGKPAWMPKPYVRLLLPGTGKRPLAAPYSTVTLLARLRGLCDHITSLRDMSAPQAKNLAASPCGILFRAIKVVNTALASMRFCGVLNLQQVKMKS
jgi:hypothetical protein